MNYKALAKIDLHCHLDGSVRPETIRELALEKNIELAADLEKELIAPETCQSLDEYLLRFDLPVRVMQSKKNIERITFELYEDSALENVKYLEVRFGPLLHVLEGLTLDEVFQSVLAGMKRAEAKYDIKGRVIVSILRSMRKGRLYELIDTAAKYLDEGVVAIDLAASEPEGFCLEFVPYISYAREQGFHVTIHAGETGFGQNVTDAIELLYAERIGHGVYIKDDTKAFELVKSNSVVLEVCPTSNVQTKAVKDYNSHPINDFYNKGIKITINTDNRTVSNTCMTKEVESVMKAFNLSLEDYHNIYRNSVERAFISDDEKTELLSKISVI